MSLDMLHWTDRLMQLPRLNDYKNVSRFPGAINMRTTDIQQAATDLQCNISQYHLGHMSDNLPQKLYWFSSAGQHVNTKSHRQH